jgi:hypothetical protein
MFISGNPSATRTERNIGTRRSQCIADLFSDRLPLPEVFEDDSEAGWTLWDTSVASQWPSAGGPPAFVLAQRPLAFIPAGHPLTVDAVLAVARVHNRVCPMPARWLLLHDRLTLGGARRHTPVAPPPLCGRAWTSTSAITKRVRMREQITWAADYGGLRDVYDWMLGLDESDWLHFGQ